MAYKNKPPFEAAHLRNRKLENPEVGTRLAKSDPRSWTAPRLSHSGRNRIAPPFPRIGGQRRPLPRCPRRAFPVLVAASALLCGAGGGADRSPVCFHHRGSRVRRFLTNVRKASPPPCSTRPDRRRRGGGEPVSPPSSTAPSAKGRAPGDPGPARGAHRGSAPALAGSRLAFRRAAGRGRMAAGCSPELRLSSRGRPSPVAPSEGASPGRSAGFLPGPAASEFRAA